MLVAGVVLFVIFLAIEWRFAELPILPARLFQYNKSTSTLIYINLLIGWIYWGNLFIVPLYLQNVRGMSPSQAALVMLSMVISHGLTSATSGVLISALGHYKPVIVFGSFCWVMGAFAKMHYDHATPIWQIVVVGIFDGIGVGCSLQPGEKSEGGGDDNRGPLAHGYFVVIVGMLAGSKNDDRAVMTGLRNFMRDMGGAIGTTGRHKFRPY